MKSRTPRSVGRVIGRYSDGVTGSTKTDWKTCALPVVGSRPTGTIGSVRRDPGTWPQVVTRPATMSWTCARVIPGTGLARFVTRHTPLRAIRVSTRPGGTPGPRAGATHDAHSITVQAVARD